MKKHATEVSGPKQDSIALLQVFSDLELGDGVQNMVPLSLLSLYVRKILSREETLTIIDAIYADRISRNPTYKSIIKRPLVKQTVGMNL